MEETVRIDFRYGEWTEPPRTDRIERKDNELSPNTVYLDGACRGPYIDAENRIYSFDHHGDCVRLATKATCEQVLTALILGLDPTGMRVVVNALDADSSLSVWLLRNRNKIDDPRVVEIVSAIGFVDAHGPIRSPAKLHRLLTRDFSEQQTEVLLWEDQKKIDLWYEQGDGALPEPPIEPPCSGFGFDALGLFMQFDKYDQLQDFADAYARGCVVAVLCPNGPSNTIGYTIGKRSDFFTYDIPAFLEDMNQQEPGWGGGSTIGGAPRCEGGRRSTLPIERVIDRLKWDGEFARNRDHLFLDSSFSPLPISRPLMSARAMHLLVTRNATRQVIHAKSGQKRGQDLSRIIISI